MKNKLNLSVVEKLLIAGFESEEKNQGSFTAEDLVVCAWRLYPDTFGLAGYRDENGHLQYPDSNRVFAEIMGSKPIRHRGYLKKIGTKKYQLTEAGRAEASRLKGCSLPIYTKKISLPREFENELQRLLTSRAAEKARNQNLDGISFFDACSFWKISSRSSAIEFDGKIANLDNILKISSSAVADNDVSFTHGGQTINKNDIQLLEQINLFLLEKYKSEIDIIRSRTDERE